MKDEKSAAHLRRELDEVLKKWRRLPACPAEGGWIRNLREALSMTTRELGQRMGLSPAGVSSLEVSEMKETISLESLQRVAKALDCQLVYALVPRHSLTHTVERRRQRIARADLDIVLDGKTIKEYRDLVAAYAQSVKRERLWRE